MLRWMNHHDLWPCRHHAAQEAGSERSGAAALCTSVGEDKHAPGCLIRHAIAHISHAFLCGAERPLNCQHGAKPGICLRAAPHPGQQREQHSCCQADGGGREGGKAPFPAMSNTTPSKQPFSASSNSSPSKQPMTPAFKSNWRLEDGDRPSRALQVVHELHSRCVAWASCSLSTNEVVGSECSCGTAAGHPLRLQA